MPPASRTTHKSGARRAIERHWRDRVKRLRALLRQEDVDALLLTNPKDIHYLTGFHGEDSWAAVTSRAVTIISDFRFQEELAGATTSRIAIRDGAIHDAAADVLEKCERIALQAEHLTIAQRGRLASRLGASRLKNTTGLVAQLRVCKDEHEVATIRKAVRIQERAIEATLERIGPGDAEVEIAAELEYQMKSLGASGPSFDTIVAARANGSRPHYRPARVKAAKNQPLLIDWGAVVDGYCSDMTRTFSFGRWPKAVREIYDIVLEAHLAAIDVVAPGVRCSDIDAVARDIITQAGYGDAFGHGLGHGIGLDIHEGPRLSRQSNEALEPGMVVTVEPGIYLPGVGGVRIEDDILVTERGRRNLCFLPKAIDWATR